MGTCTDAERRLIEAVIKADYDGKERRGAMADVVMERVSPELMEKLVRREMVFAQLRDEQDAIFGQFEKLGIIGEQLVGAVLEKATKEAERRNAERKAEARG